MARQQGPAATEAAGAIGKIMLLLVFIFFWLVIGGAIFWALAGSKGLIGLGVLSLFVVLGILTAGRRR